MVRHVQGVINNLVLSLRRAIIWLIFYRHRDKAILTTVKFLLVLTFSFFLFLLISDNRVKNDKSDAEHLIMKVDFI